MHLQDIFLLPCPEHVPALSGVVAVRESASGKGGTECFQIRFHPISCLYQCSDSSGDILRTFPASLDFQGCHAIRHQLLHVGDEAEVFQGEGTDTCFSRRRKWQTARLGTASPVGAAGTDHRRKTALSGYAHAEGTVNEMFDFNAALT